MKNKKNVTPITTTISGALTIPADKSISHRSIMFASLACEPIEINNFSKGKDCHSTLAVLKQLGAKVEFKSEQSLIFNMPNGYQKPEGILDAGNSGTTIRLMSGILAGQDFDCEITGDESLCKRPMGRVIKPLSLMGADISGKEDKAPLKINGKKLKAIEYNSPLASAQVKSCVLLAGLFADGETTVIEPHKSRDHTERMLEFMGANLQVDGDKVSVAKSKLTPKTLNIPGDISSAAFFMVAGAIVKDADLTIQNVGLNPTRTGIIDVLKQMGANLSIDNERIECGEPVGDVKVSYSPNLKGIEISGDIIPRLIDELPVIALLASQANGNTVVKDAQDLRAKESDRIVVTCSELSKVGVDIEETPDGFIVTGKTQLKGGATLECYHDHRLAMTGYVAGLICDSPIEINEFNWVDISFPEFASIFEGLVK